MPRSVLRGHGGQGRGGEQRRARDNPVPILDGPCQVRGVGWRFESVMPALAIAWMVTVFARPVQRRGVDEHGDTIFRDAAALHEVA